MPLRPLAAALAAAALAAGLPASALGQGSNPFGPLAPSTPPPAPKPEEAPQPERVEPDNPDLSTRDSVLLAVIAAVLIGGVAFAIAREGGRIGARRRGAAVRATRRSRGRGAAAFKATAGTPARARSAKTPPPPPRKRARRKPSKKR